MTHRRHQHHNRTLETSEPASNGNLSPAQRYASYRRRTVVARSAAGQFAATLPFSLDAFQINANEALEAGQNVLVAAPTGAGKTIIADFAIFLAQRHNVKAFYTTPIKALSNQKYHDLAQVYGADHVGLLTGDTSINPQADIVVMTTEVLRNMLYEHSTTLQSLQYVILDEVHYLADRFRGPVWEEVIIHLPQHVKIIALSATVSNVEDFSAWITSVCGDTKLIVSEHRPVPLRQHVLVQAGNHNEPELLDLYQSDKDDKQSTRLNAHLVDRLDQLDRQAARRKQIRESSHHSGRYHAHNAHQLENEHPVRYMPRRWAVVDELNYLDMLPGIYFIFSRNGCDQAVEQCIEAGLELTSDEERLRVDRIVDDTVEGQLSRDDLKALHFSQFRFALEQGFAAHHAGMIALYRQIVERLFEEGLVKMVFATETLALGINMPARCVIVEKLEKFNGVDHVTLTPGEFTQLTGRAGRRGIDTLGHAVVVDHRGFVPATAASLSSKRVYPLHSSFKATFNMAVNLLNSSDYQTARRTLDHSFAQWEANESAGQLESRMLALHAAIDGYEQAFTCSHGDFKELMTIRMCLRQLEKNERASLKRRVFTSDDERRDAFRTLDERIVQFREADKNHPCRNCPDIEEHMKWGHRWMREQTELSQLQERYDTRTGSVARQFDAICEILKALQYLDDNGDGISQNNEQNDHDMMLTARGQVLRHIYSEQDIVLAQALCEGVFDELNAQELAAVLSSFVYQARRSSEGEPRHYPGGAQGAVARTAQSLRSMHHQLNTLCQDYGLSALEPLDFSIADIIYAWSGDASLGTVLYDSDLTGGDFVRNAKRLADLLQQVTQAASYLSDKSHVAQAAHEAHVYINRGVVAYSGVEG